MKKTTNRIVTVLLAIILILGISVPAKAANAFTDVPSWCADAANWAAAQGIAAGYGNGKFGPDDTCTRAQIITMLWRAEGQPAARVKYPDRNNQIASYYKDAVDWAYSDGIASDYASPNCPRSEAMLSIWKAFGSPDASKDTGFSDVPAYKQYTRAVSWAVTNGIAAGTGNGKFSPDTPCTRGQIVTFLYRAYVPSARLDTPGNTPTPTPAPTPTPTPTPSGNSTFAENRLKAYAPDGIQTLVKSVSTPTAANSDNKNTTSYGTVDWSTAAQGYITFKASGGERVFILETPNGVQTAFGVANGTTIKVALTNGVGKYQYAIGHYNDAKNAHWIDYKNSFQVDKVDTDLAPYLVSTPYGDYANAPKATAEAKELYDAGKGQLTNVEAIVKYARNLTYDKSLKQGGTSIYVNPDSVIANGGGVCNEMSKLLTAMLRSQGIPAYYQCGNGGEHAWVMAWVELSSETTNGVTYSRGGWVLIEATSGTVKRASETSNYVADSYAN